MNNALGDFTFKIQGKPLDLLSRIVAVLAERCGSPNLTEISVDDLAKVEGIAISRLDDKVLISAKRHSAEPFRFHVGKGIEALDDVMVNDVPHRVVMYDRHTGDAWVVPIAEQATEPEWPEEL